MGMEVKMPTRFTTTLIAASIALASTTVSAFAGPLQDRIDAGEPIRIGFSNIPPWGYPDGFTGVNTVLQRTGNHRHCGSCNHDARGN